jgi:hypothetical protein
MAPPRTIRVKLSSEAAGAVSLTPVLNQELELRELIELALGIAGKDEARVREILLRGTLVVGASRFRWQGWQAEQDELREILASFPDADPTRRFASERCVRVILRGGLRFAECSREDAAGEAFFRRTSFWSALMELAAGADYAGYSYRNRADRYRRELTRENLSTLRAASGGLPRSALKSQLQPQDFGALEAYATRGL